MPSPHERRYRRFKLQFPVHLLFRSGELTSAADAVSRNVSIGGLLVDCPVLIPRHSAVNFVIDLGGHTLRPVELAGEGEVVRVGRAVARNEFAVALECKNPITQMEPYLPDNSN